MFSMARIFIACVAGVSAFHAVDRKRVLFFGASLDRNALLDFCWTQGENTEQTTTPLQTNWCFHHKLNVKLGYIWHPGVGMYGDLRRPFAQAKAIATGKILVRYANKAADDMLGGTPHLVVVDSSLWDLLVWRLGTLGEKGAKSVPINVTEERVQQWCQYDLPRFLGNVSEAFPTSRIAFRTAPTIDHTPKGDRFAKRDIKLLYQCITSSKKKGKLFGKYEVIDYHAIVDNLIEEKVPNLFGNDGYHPDLYPSLLYMDEVLRSVGLNPPEPQLDEKKKSQRRAAIRDDPNDLDLI